MLTRDGWCWPPADVQHCSRMLIACGCCRCPSGSESRPTTSLVSGGERNHNMVSCYANKYPQRIVECHRHMSMDISFVGGGHIHIWNCDPVVTFKTRLQTYCTDVSHQVQTGFSCLQADLQPHHIIHTHRLSVHTCTRVRNSRRDWKTMRGGGCGQPKQWRVPAQSREDGCSQNGLVSWLQGLFSWLWFSSLQ